MTVISADATEFSEDFEPKKQVKKLTSDLYQPDKFADIFCNAAQSQKSIDDCLKNNIKQVFKNDKEIHEKIESIIRDCNKKDVILNLKKIGSVLSYLLTLIAGSCITFFIQKFLK